jgi:hypothetical protein
MKLIYLSIIALFISCGPCGQEKEIQDITDFTGQRVISIHDGTDGHGDIPYYVCEFIQLPGEWHKIYITPEQIHLYVAGDTIK